MLIFYFFFSSRRRHTRLQGDWSSDVCSSDLFRLALGVSLPDVVAQVQARYEADGREVPGFSETLLSAYESGHKRPGTEYLHYLCASYGADPADLGFEARCLCGRSHRAGAEAGPAGTA